MSLPISPHGISPVMVCSSLSVECCGNITYFANIPTMNWNVVENENENSARSWTLSRGSDHV